MIEFENKFSYESGAKLEAVDFTDIGVKLSLSHPQWEDLAIIIPPVKAKEFGLWLIKGLGQEIPSLPPQLLEILTRAVETKGTDIKLARGDKSRFREMLKVLRYYKRVSKDATTNKAGRSV